MSQFKALSVKNWILWKRNKCGNITQIIMPILFIRLLIVLRQNIQIQSYEEMSFIDQGQFKYRIQGNDYSYLRDCWDDQIVALAPAGNLLIQSLNKSLVEVKGYNTQIFDSIAALEQSAKSGAQMCFGVSVEESTPRGSYQYTIRFNQNRYYSDPPTIMPLELNEPLNTNIFQNAVYGGSVALVTFINTLILQSETGSTNDILINKIVPTYQEAYQKDEIYKYGNLLVGIIFLFPLLIVYLRQTSNILQEKQKKIRETMCIMGMKISVYYATWFLRYFVTFSTIHVVGAFIISSQLPHVGFVIPFIIFILFDSVLIIQSFFIQIFFSRAKVGVIGALLFFIFQCIISTVMGDSDSPQIGVNTKISIIPHTAFSLAIGTMLYAQSVKAELTFFDVLNQYQISIAVASLALNILFWLILTWYLDQVFPNEFGAKKHPLWCCFSKRKNISNSQENEQSRQCFDEAKNKNIQQVDQRFKKLQKDNQIINISHLRKEFNGGSLVAVDDLNVKMYNDNIFVMLGHNGAGKTTTISMLTGMLSSTEGKIEVMGETEVQKIREKIGICPQHNTLYDELTVQEHLRLFGTFKGLVGQDLAEQVKKLIADVNLAQKRDQYSKNLSGGQKRRLSVAMAFSGRSKVIILDEPTSGMDTSARRYVWELLKSYKSDRIILLTTHFMDEADYLGDRIGIMAGGKLVCCGSGYYLKNKFGVGYNITFVKEDSQKASIKIVEVVQKYIPTAIVLTDVSSQIAMQLPMDEVKKFPALFNEIDSKIDYFGISTYGISITTLEEVFLKVGQDTTDIADIKRCSVQLEQPEKMMHLDDENDLNKNKEGSSQRIDKSPQKSKLTTESDLHASLLERDQMIEKVNGRYSIFKVHLKATLIKRIRVIRRDYKSFAFELILPIILITLPFLLASISFMVYLPERQLSLATYSQMASPLTFAIGSANQTLLENLQKKVNAKYTTNEIDLNKDTKQTDSAFDKSYLFPRKMSKDFFLGGVFFNGNTTTDNVYEYSTIINTKIPTSCLFLQTLAAETYINEITNGNISITVSQAPFPIFYQFYMASQTKAIIAGLLFSVAFAFKFSSTVSFIVKERQDRCKHQQIVSGINIYAYWFGNFLYDYVMYLLLAAFSLLIIFIMNIDAYKGDALSVTIVVFLLYGLSYIPLTYIASYVFKNYGRAQTGFYYFTFITGVIVSVIYRSFRQYDSYKIYTYSNWLVRFLPAYVFGEIFLNLATIKSLSYSEKGQDQHYVPWDPEIALVPVLYLIICSVIYTAILLFLEKALSSQKFMRYFTRKENQIGETQQILDSDVIAEKQKALEAEPKEFEILTKNLRKVFILDSKKKHKVAVDNLSFGIQKGEVFGLLGINGAGKTTTFKMLAGEITSTSGDSYFTGMKISENLNKIRQNLGYCPQFDALVEKLTVREQLQLFYDLKSLSATYKDQVVQRKIKQMDLTDYKDKLSGTLSGGNKRKLSVAMAMIGNPSIIFLDEPSTGMDPKARRFMWKIISQIASEKKQSTIILTTHSMEQAESLSTRLGIMVKGNFKCIGTPQHIKSRYGQGYQIEIKIVPISKEQFNAYMTENQLQSKINVTKQELQVFLEQLRVSAALKAEIGLTGSGSYIHNQLVSTNKIETSQLVDFVLLYGKIQKIKAWMQSNFGGCEVIESFQTFIRFKVTGKMSVGKMFEALEVEKDKIGIESYSIKQATVEQIFNRFAENSQGEQFV